MERTTYEDYKYGMQDLSHIYVGCKYTFGELLEAENVMFKFRMIVKRDILPEADMEDTLETHFYYLTPDSFLVKLYRQLKAKVKVNVIEEKRTFFGAGRRESGSGKAGAKRYVTRVLTVEELVRIPPAQKEREGYVIQELCISKLALAAL